MQSSDHEDDGAETYSYFLPQGLGLLDEQDEVFDSGRSNEAGRLTKPEPAQHKLPQSSRFASEFVPAANRPLLQTRTIFPKEYNASPLASFSQTNTNYSDEAKGSGLYTYSPRLNPTFPGPGSLDSPRDETLNMNDPPLFSQRSVLASLGLGLVGSPRPIVDDDPHTDEGHPRLSGSLLDNFKAGLPATREVRIQPRAGSPKAKPAPAQQRKQQSSTARGGKGKQTTRNAKANVSREPNVIQVVPHRVPATSWAKVGAAKPGFLKALQGNSRPAGSQSANAAQPIPYSGVHSHVGKKHDREEKRQRGGKRASSVHAAKQSAVKGAKSSTASNKAERRSGTNTSSKEPGKRNSDKTAKPTNQQQPNQPAAHGQSATKQASDRNQHAKGPGRSKQPKPRHRREHQDDFKRENTPSARPASPSPSQSSQSSVAVDPPPRRQSPTAGAKSTPTPSSKKSKKKKKKKQKAEKVDASEARSEDGNEGEGGEGGAAALHPGDNNAEYIPYETDPPVHVASPSEAPATVQYSKPRTDSTQSDHTSLRRRTKKNKTKQQPSKSTPGPKTKSVSESESDRPNMLQHVVSKLPPIPQVCCDWNLKPMSRKVAAKFWSVIAIFVRLVVHFCSKVAISAAKVHVKAAHVLAADHHLAFAFSFLYVFPWLAHSLVYWAPPWVAPCLFYAFLMQMFCTQGPPVLVAVFRCLLPLLFLTESVAHHACLLHLNGAERLVVAFVLSSFKTQDFFRPLFLLVLSVEIFASFLFGHYMLMHWVIFVCSLLSIRPSSASEVAASLRGPGAGGKQVFTGSVAQTSSQTGDWHEKSLPPLVNAAAQEPKPDTSVLTPTNTKARRKAKTRRSHRGH